MAYVEASPLSLARRMALVESRLAGKHKLVLASPGANLVERLKKVPGISDAGLWTWPFEVALLQSKLGSDDMFTREMLVFQLTPDLFKGRSYYFKGSYTGDNGAKKYFLQSRHSEESLDAYKLPPEAMQRVKKEDISKVEALQIVQLRRARQDAGYWLGMIQFQMQDYPAAVFFFDRGTLQDSPTGPWTAGAHYNLGRTYEAMGDVEKAIAQYEADTTSPQSFGSRLRARHLRDRQATAEARPSASGSLAGKIAAVDDGRRCQHYCWPLPGERLDRGPASRGTAERPRGDRCATSWPSAPVRSHRPTFCAGSSRP